MSEFGLIADIGTIRFARLLPGPCERIWDFLVRAEPLATWLAAGEIQLHLGGFVELSFDVTEGKNKPESDLPVSGVVTRCQPPESLAFTWTDSSTISHVMFELERRKTEVLLLLTHAELPPERAIACAASWHAHLDMLEARLRNLQPESHGSCVRRVLPHYENYRDARLLRARPPSGGNLERVTAH